MHKRAQEKDRGVYHGGTARVLLLPRPRPRTITPALLGVFLLAALAYAIFGVSTPRFQAVREKRAGKQLCPETQSGHVSLSNQRKRSSSSSLDRGKQAEDD